MWYVEYGDRKVELILYIFNIFLKVFGICNERSPFLMIVELMANGDLKSYLLANGDGVTTFDQLLSISENVREILLFSQILQIFFFFLQIACGMRALELEGIVHRDLAARQVFLCKFIFPKHPTLNEIFLQEYHVG